MSGEVPATKLAALQKVLQSDFLNGEEKNFLERI
jgi:L27 domain